MLQGLNERLWHAVIWLLRWPQAQLANSAAHTGRSLTWNNSVRCSVLKDSSNPGPSDGGSSGKALHTASALILESHLFDFVQKLHLWNMYVYSLIIIIMIIIIIITTTDRWYSRALIWQKTFLCVPDLLRWWEMTNFTLSLDKLCNVYFSDVMTIGSERLIAFVIFRQMLLPSSQIPYETAS